MPHITEYPSFGFKEAPFAEALVGLKIEIVQGHDLEVGDEIITFHCVNFHHQAPVKITRIKKDGDFIIIKYQGKDGPAATKFAHTYLFGRVQRT